MKVGNVQLSAARRKQNVIYGSTLDGRDLTRSNDTPTCLFFFLFFPRLSDSDVKMPLLLLRVCTAAGNQNQNTFY